MDKLLEAKGPIIHSGQHPGLPAKQIPLWESGSNVLFEDQSVKPAPGQGNLFIAASPDRITGLAAIYVQSGASLTPGIIYGTGTKLYRGVAPPNVVDFSRPAIAYTGTVNDQWSIAQFGQAALATNGKDQVQYLAPGGGNFVDISTVSDLAASFRAKIVKVNGPYVLFFGTDNNLSEFRWCDEDNPLLWTPSAVNSARDLQIRDLLSDIIAVEDFADGLIVLGRTQAHFVRYIGAPFYFSQDHLIGGVGATSKNSVLGLDRLAYGFGPQGIWETDGSIVNYISMPSIHKHVYEDTYDPARFNEVVAWAEDDNLEIYWSYPTLDGLGTTISFNRRERAWSLHDYWRVAGDSGGPWQFPITVSQSAAILGRGDNGGVPIVGSPVPISMSDSMFLRSGYGMLSYGGHVYGGAKNYE